ncbi:MAG: alanine dehydrogenase [Synergistaceae bacterium]|jgi:alanine dehydrogenase|nr:alanine dehydrogenase [Synergistaceae bacterium]
MKIGCPREIKNREYRVGLTPASTAAYTKAGHEVFVERGAGVHSGFLDAEYEAAGAKILERAAKVWEGAEMIVKVKEPMPEEYGSMRESQIVYTYFHFAANRPLTDACLKSGASCVAYELVRESWGLPLLLPMSEVAGRMSILMGSYYLGKSHGGSGVLPMGVPGVAPAEILVIGGGTVGINAAKTASGIGARVTITDVDQRRLAYLAEVMPANCVPLFSDELSLADAIAKSDMVIGAVLLPGGAKAPRLVARNHLRTMRRGSVFVDVAIDQGGIAETSRPTTHDDPVFVEEGIVHYCVANMPGAYGRTATSALSNATIKYGLELANKGLKGACRDNPAIRLGLSTYRGALTVEAVAEAFGLQNIFKDASQALGL